MDQAGYDRAQLSLSDLVNVYFHLDERELVPLPALLVVFGLAVSGLAVLDEVQRLAQGRLDVSSGQLTGGQHLLSLGQLLADQRLLLGGQVFRHGTFEARSATLRRLCPLQGAIQRRVRRRTLSRHRALQ
ncbi:MAG: hypothetical protein ACRDYA_24015 [Egibacteraceae bacterium]